MEENSSECCWLCLCGAEETHKQLVKCCKCPRPVHRECLARWQLQKAGQREERFCRFCFEEFPDWKDSLTPSDLKPTTPIMAVSVKGKIHKLRVKPGPEGKEDFKRQVRQLLGYTDDMEFDVIFECKTPHDGEKVQLHGFSAFDAATHCAAVSAAKRLKNKQPKPAQPAAPQNDSSSGDAMHGAPAAISSSSTLGTSRQELHINDRLSPLAGSATQRSSCGSMVSCALSSSSSESMPVPGNSCGNTTPASAQLQADHSQHCMMRQHELYMQHHTPRQSGQQQPLGHPAADKPLQAQLQQTATPPTGEVAGWQVNTSAVHSSQAAWPAAQQHAILLTSPGRSVSSTSADASAMLTAADAVGTGPSATAGSSLSSYRSAAAATAGTDLLVGCPLGLQPCNAGSSDNTAAAAEAAAAEYGLWANCNSMSEPLPLVNTEISNAAACRASSRTGAAAAGSVGCMGRLGGGSSNHRNSRLAAWLKHWGVKKTSRTAA